MKLQHWLISVECLPGRENGFADALLREERPRRIETVAESSSSLARGMWGTAPRKIRLRGKRLVGVPRQNSEQFHSCILVSAHSRNGKV